MAGRRILNLISFLRPSPTTSRANIPSSCILNSPKIDPMKILRTLPLLFLVMCLPRAGAETSFGVDRTELVTDLVAGTTRTLRFNVNNPGTEVVPFTVYEEDFEIANGVPVLSKKSG